MLYNDNIIYIFDTLTFIFEGSGFSHCKYQLSMFMKKILLHNMQHDISNTAVVQAKWLHKLTAKLFRKINVTLVENFTLSN